MFNWIPDAVFTWWWIVWIVVGFGVPEGLALVRSKRGDTLSEHTWKWFSLKGDKSRLRPLQVVARFGFLAFWAWLSFHFLAGGSFL